MTINIENYKTLESQRELQLADLVQLKVGKTELNYFVYGVIRSENIALCAITTVADDTIRVPLTGAISVNGVTATRYRRISVKSSVSVGYFVLRKVDYEGSVAIAVAKMMQNGFSVLTDNRYIVFGKHKNPELPVEMVGAIFIDVFNINPHIYEDLEDFFTKNNL